MPRYFHMLGFASTVYHRRHLALLQIKMQGTPPVSRRVDTSNDGRLQQSISVVCFVEPGLGHTLILWANMS